MCVYTYTPCIQYISINIYIYTINVYMHIHFYTYALNRPQQPVKFLYVYMTANPTGGVIFESSKLCVSDYAIITRIYTYIYIHTQ